MKKVWIQFAVALGCLLALSCAAVLIVDPLYYFHKPAAGTSPYFHNQVYQTSGMARHFDYDSAIVGSSMTENFRSSWFAEAGKNTIKLSYAGARSADLKSILEDVFESGNQVEFVLMDINDFQLTSDPIYTFVEKDDTEHGDGVLDGPEYLLNNDVLWMAAGRVAEAVTGNTPDIDEAYTWEDPALFSADRVKMESKEVLDALRWQLAEGMLESREVEVLKNYCDGNLANLLPVIQAHPETEFIIYYPPYSILYWQEQIVQERLESVMEVYRYSIEQLLALDNVRIFYFQDEEEMITDLDNYRDVCHHTPQINRYIFDCIQSGQRELTPENMDGYLENMYRIASEYPYEEIWADWE